MRVLALESRRAVEMAELIRRQGGEPFVAPAMREVPIEEHADVFRFAERLFASEFEMMILLTGVGTRQLNRVLSARYGETAFADALRRIAVVARGPKPVAALRELGVTPAAVAPEPNTWRELLEAIAGRGERRIAVQEYGRSNAELLEALRARGGEVTVVRVYQYGLPENVEPLARGGARAGSGRVSGGAVYDRGADCAPGADGAGTGDRRRGAGRAAAMPDRVDRADDHGGAGGVRHPTHAGTEPSENGDSGEGSGGARGRLN